MKHIRLIVFKPFTQSQFSTAVCFAWEFKLVLRSSAARADDYRLMSGDQGMGNGADNKERVQGEV